MVALIEERDRGKEGFVKKEGRKKERRSEKQEVERREHKTNKQGKAQQCRFDYGEMSLGLVSTTILLLVRMIKIDGDGLDSS